MVGKAGEVRRGGALGAARAGCVGAPTGLVSCMCGPGIITRLSRIMSLVGRAKTTTPGGVPPAIILATVERIALVSAAHS